MLVPTFPPIDPAIRNPVPAILASREFSDAAYLLADSPASKDGLVSATSQAMLYTLIRLFRPQIAVEIGTYRASTTQAMARAVAANGNGTIHTIDPYGADHLPGILAEWPQNLRAVTELHLTDSMIFFTWMQRKALRSGLVFVDGNHGYEFALFDIQSAARAMNLGGFIVIDNISQPGPFFAARDFMSSVFAAGWHECGGTLEQFNPRLPFDPKRSTIATTDLCILRAPHVIEIGARPIGFGELSWEVGNKGLQLQLASESAGLLHIQFIIRTFGAIPTEIAESMSVSVSPGSDVEIIPIPFPKAEERIRKTVEPWISWEGENGLLMKDFPTIC